jgi:thiamine biosynthesis lipoprotein
MIWPLRRGAKTVPVTKCIPVMGTFAHQEVDGINSNFAVENGCLELSRLDSLWSPDKPGNIVDLIGKSAGISLVPADPDTLQIIATAKEFATLSGGAFDITADPIIRLWLEAAPKKQTPPSKEN